MAALASLSAATLLPGNLNAQPAPVPFTEQNTATPDKQEILSIARKVADWQIKEFSNNKYAVRAERLDSRCPLYGNVRLGGTQR